MFSHPPAYPCIFILIMLFLWPMTSENKTVMIIEDEPDAAECSPK